MHPDDVVVKRQLRRRPVFFCISRSAHPLLSPSDMTQRRTILSIGLLGILATAPSRVHGATDAEGVGYGGTTAGAWACGPIGRVNYAGGGARVRVAETKAPLGGRGWTADVAGAAEREHTAFVSCDGTCGSNDHVMPPDSTLYGGHARVGHSWEVFGVEAGATVLETFPHNTDDGPRPDVVPDVELSLRSHDKVRGMIGVGSPSVQTLIRPGLYGGVQVALGDVEVGGTVGAFRVGPSGDLGARAEASAILPVTEVVKIKVAGSVSGNEKGGPGGEGVAGAIASF